VIDTTTFRTKEQVLLDLSKALGFSPASLEANRKGRISAEQFKQFIGRCMSPAGMAVFWAIAPFVFWAGLTGMREHASFSAALNIFVGQLLHLSEMLESKGKISTMATVGSVLGCLGMAAYSATRFSAGLYFDLLAREVVRREGRVTAREEQIMRPNGRDPIERYFFDVKTHKYDVSLAAYQALENGAMYVMYVLPRSGVLVALEPKVTQADGFVAHSTAPAPREVTPPAPVST
jgi:hypothetical protein